MRFTEGMDFLKNISTFGQRQLSGVNQDYKVIVLYLVSALGVAVMILLGIIAFGHSKHWLGIADLTAAIGVTLNAVYLRKTGNYNFASHIGTASMGLFFLFLFITRSALYTGPLWFYTYPLFALYLMGSTRGAMMTLLLFTFAMASQFLARIWLALPSYPIDFLIGFVPSFFLVFLYAYLYERIVERNREQLESINEGLDRKIMDQTLELRVSNESLKSMKVDLERRVAVRTADLSNTNQKLTLEIERHKRTAEALKTAKEAADKANRAKSEFLANMSHELRTPLNHIIGFTDLVVGKNFGDLNETQEEYLGDVLHSSKHLLSLINDILDLSKVEAGKLELNLGRVNIKEVLEGSLVMIKEKALKHRIRVEKDLDGIAEVMRADERKLKQIMYNLLSNAVKFTSDHGVIMVTARHLTAVHGQRASDGGTTAQLPERQHPHSGVNGELLEISVRDSGIGIKAEDLERIFKPFEQVDSKESRRYQGTGLGLSLTKSLVELHGGKIWAESEGEGKGSVFRFVLPIGRAA
jgi:signal transduction histidine kinase